MPLTFEETRNFFSIILGREPENENVVNLLISCFPTADALVANLISTPEFVSRNFYGKVPSFLLSRDKYLFKDIGEKARCDHFFYHNNYLCKNMSEVGYVNLIKGDVTLYQSCPEGSLYQITLNQAGFSAFEGELALTLKANGAGIFAIAFNIVLGSILGKSNNSAILVSRLQGIPGKFESIRRATKELHEISPPHFLYSALMGLARAFGIDIIGGVCGSKHCSYDPERDEHFTTTYDAFFDSIGADRTEDGFFVTSISEKADSDRMVTAGHRSRTRRKRKMKADIARSVEVFSRVTFNPAQQVHDDYRNGR